MSIMRRKRGVAECDASDRRLVITARWSAALRDISTWMGEDHNLYHTASLFSVLLLDLFSALLLYSRF